MDPTALEIGKLILTLAAVATAYAKIQSSIRGMAGKGEIREITNDPLHIQSRSRLATMEDVESVDKEVRSLEKRFDRHLDKLEANQAEITASLSDLKNSLHDEMRDHQDRISDRLSVIDRSIGRLEGNP